MRLNPFPLEEKIMVFSFLPYISPSIDRSASYPRSAVSCEAPLHRLMAPRRSFSCYLEQRSTVSWEIRRGGNRHTLTFADSDWLPDLPSHPVLRAYL